MDQALTRSTHPLGLRSDHVCDALSRAPGGPGWCSSPSVRTQSPAAAHQVCAPSLTMRAHPVGVRLAWLVQPARMHAPHLLFALRQGLFAALTAPCVSLRFVQCTSWHGHVPAAWCSTRCTSAQDATQATRHRFCCWSARKRPVGGSAPRYTRGPSGWGCSIKVYSKQSQGPQPVCGTLCQTQHKKPPPDPAPEATASPSTTRSYTPPIPCARPTPLILDPP